ncbi:MAG: TonB-dependent receptor plug domain-containing protein [Verrucomicrobiales bacterium]|nr:TonB-dependent receptor plug domain-containing protein [Verrucomicrobiales bacterium]
MKLSFSRFLPLMLALDIAASPVGSSAQDAEPAAGGAVLTADTLETVIVTGKAENLLGEAPSASKGQSSAEELAQRPFLRRGELMEVVPGMVVTQHSGGGKANQYFLRGFNLDHGTDFGIFVDGMPVNARTHGHGQGYADINFLIPELVEQLDYFKGPYFSDLGDFTTAGAARFRLYRELPEGIASVTYGSDNYCRGLLADSVAAGPGVATFALEYNYYDGPWVSPDELQRWNGFFRYSVGDDDDYASLTLMGSDTTWDATDQVPSRLIRSGEIDRFGFVDPTNGGTTHRYSLSFDTQQTGDSGVTRASAYAGTYQLDLYSNFTLFLADPERGDQFNQFDDRWFAGGSVSHEFQGLDLVGRDADVTVGLQTHHDWIDGVGLHLSDGRKRLSTVREDDVYEASIGGFTDAEIRWTDWMRTTTGVRADVYYFDVDARTLPVNSGSTWDGIVSPKAGVVFGPWAETELYLNGGFGFHSNDARGTTIRRDPVTGESLSPIDPLIRTKGAEVGVRTQIIPNLTSTLAVWYLHSDSELVYVGDAGNIEAGDASERYGVEWSNYWRPVSWVYLDTEFTTTDSRFLSGEEIENSVPLSFSGGIHFGEETGPFAGLRARYFSPRPLNGDGSVESSDAFQLNARVGYRKDQWEVALEVLNLLDADDNDIEYFYASRLPGEPIDGVEDIHLHPYEPRQLRLSVSYRW